MRLRLPALLAVAAVVLASLVAVRPAPFAAGSPAPPAKPAAPAQPAVAAAPATSGSAAASHGRTSWQQVDRLVAAGKLEAASRLVTRLRERARARGDEAGWAQGLLREVQLRTALHGYETAARFLKDQPWPRAPLYRTALDLFYGGTLAGYYHAYQWDIRSRTRVAAAGDVDLAQWTGEQLCAAAAGAYREAWERRAELGAEPVTRLPGYLEPNNYPPGVRGTLRDALSYLFADLLGDTSCWSPRESNELYLLDVPALIAGEPGRAAALKLDDPAVHPLLKLGAVLADLEAWHAAAGRRAAALEARLERLRHLHAALTRADDRALLRADLARRLAGFRSDAWWAAGMAQLAELVQQADEPDSLKRARDLLLEGEKAYPGSPGGRRCHALRAAIEAPAFKLVAMAADAPGRRSLQVTHKNLARLYFRAYPVDVRRQLARGEPPEGSWLLEPEPRRLAALGAPAATWVEQLPATPDYREHVTYLVPPLAAHGVYEVVASARDDFRPRAGRVVAAQLAIGDLVLLTEERPGEPLEVRVMSGATGEPQPGVPVRLYRLPGGEKVRPAPAAVRTSDAAGYVHFADSDRDGDASAVAVASRGADVAFARVSPPERNEAPSEDAALVYTDRSIYRPGQKLLWKVLAFGGLAERGRLQARTGTRVTLVLHDAAGEEVASAEATTNDFGTAAGELRLPPGRPLGSWRLECAPRGEAAVQVEEYKRPTFEVKLDDPAEAPRLNRPARFRGEARYYFGLPVTGGRVTWQASRQPVYSGWEWYAGFPPASSESQVVAAGQASLGAGGGFEIAFTPRADERDARRRPASPAGGGAGRGESAASAEGPGNDASGAGGETGDGVSYRYVVRAEVTDDGGETREAERAFRLGWVTVEAELTADEGFFLAGRPARLHVARHDLDGVPRPGDGTWRLLALAPPGATPLLPADEEAAPAPPGVYQTAGDRQRPRWAPVDSPADALAHLADGRELASGTVRTDARGQAEVELPPLPPGAYRLRYETRDDAGARGAAARELVVAAADRATPLALPVVLLAESPSVRSGGTARLLVRSGLPDQPMLLEIRRPAGVERRQLRSGRDAELVELAVGPEDRGGIRARLVALRDHQLMQEETSIQVPWDDHQLAIELTTFRDKIRPGAGETWQVRVRTVDGSAPEAAAAELLAYMYDKSLDAFVPHRPPELLSLLPEPPGFAELDSNLGASEAMWLAYETWPRVPSAPELHGDRVLLDARLRAELRRGGGGGRAHPPAIPKPAAAAAPADGVAVDEMVTVPTEAPLLEDRAIRKAAVSTAGSAGGVGAAPPPPPPPPPPRSDFAETAFWQPHLLTGADGTAAIEFKVPDSVTAWNVWVHAVTRDLRTGSLHRETRSVKELMVRPYLPRFLREGDRAELRVAVNSAAAAELRGELRVEILDPESERSLGADFGLAPGAATRPFRVAPGGGADLGFAITAPRRAGPVAFRVTATAGDLGDGELHALPVLPSRLHLMQSRFVALRGGPGRREMTFPDLRRDDDPTRINQQLTVTLDAQLFYGVLQALPYLVDYPYECSEQTLNRFLSTGIVTRLFDRHPEVARLASDLARRETPYETWDASDSNRKMALEETPWLWAAQGRDPGAGPDPELIRVLDPRIARAERDSALARLQQTQLRSGAFPWWPGGPPSPYMTLYLMYGFAKAAELGVEVPRAVVERGWSYLAAHFRDELAPLLAREPDGRQGGSPPGGDGAAAGCCLDVLTFLGYVASSYPDPSWMGKALTAEERRRILDHSFRHWREQSPYLKEMLALTLTRAGRRADARLVWDSVMDAAKTTPDEGTFWEPEDHAWLWYRDTIESHAMALRVLTELDPADPRGEGLVQWLFLNKQLDHWKSTRATAEVLYALAVWLERRGQLVAHEAATVQVGERQASFVFEPDRYTGRRNRVLVLGAELDPGHDATVVVDKQTPGMMFASATWDFSTERLPPAGSGDLFAVSRRYFRRETTGTETVLRPLGGGEALAVGDEVEVQLTLGNRAPAEYVHLRDPRAAGLEPGISLSGWRWERGLAWYEETRDSGADFFLEALPVGEHTLSYRLRANLAGTFRVGPATLQSMYAPEFAAYSGGDTMTIGAPVPGSAGGAAKRR